MCPLDYLHSNKSNVLILENMALAMDDEGSKDQANMLLLPCITLNSESQCPGR